jgi:hypothetical protein
VRPPQRTDARIHETLCTVIVQVTDSAGAPIQSVEILVRDEAHSIAASLLTDSTGQGRAELAAGSYIADIRRIGYRPATRVVQATCSESDQQVSVTLEKAPSMLATVHVLAQESERHRRLFIDAEAIENSPRRLDDAMDIIAKLRPDMVYGLGGRGFCGPATNIWINGRRIPWQLVSIKSVAASRDPSLGLPAWIKSVLASIKPEHIAQMTYHDCMDMSVGKVGSDRAIFIVLKPGIEYDPGSGSRVAARR